MLKEQSSTSLPATERKEEERISKEISKILSIQKQNSNTFNPRFQKLEASTLRNIITGKIFAPEKVVARRRQSERLIQRYRSRDRYDIW